MVRRGAIGRGSSRFTRISTRYMGEWDLMSLAFRLDLGLYYLGIVSQPFKFGERALLEPPFNSPLSRPVFRIMRLYNRRFAKIARHRRLTNALGRTNRGNRCLIPGFTLGRSDVKRLFAPLLQWMLLELREGWRSWFEQGTTIQNKWDDAEETSPIRVSVASCQCGFGCVDLRRGIRALFRREPLLVFSGRARSLDAISCPREFLRQAGKDNRSRERPARRRRF